MSIHFVLKLFLNKRTVSQAVLGDDPEKEFDLAGFEELCTEKGIDQGELNVFLTK